MEEPRGRSDGPTLGEAELVVLRLMAAGHTVESVAVDTTVEAIVWGVRHEMF